MQNWRAIWKWKHTFAIRWDFNSTGVWRYIYSYKNRWGCKLITVSRSAEVKWDLMTWNSIVMNSKWFSGVLIWPNYSPKLPPHMHYNLWSISLLPPWTSPYGQWGEISRDIQVINTLVPVGWVMDRKRKWTREESEGVRERWMGPGTGSKWEGAQRAEDRRKVLGRRELTEMAVESPGWRERQMNSWEKKGERKKKGGENEGRRSKWWPEGEK